MKGVRGPALVEIGADSLSVTVKDRSARLELGREGEIYLVALDSLTHWAPPHQDQEVAIEDLRVILRAIEAEFARRGEQVEFE